MKCNLIAQRISLQEFLTEKKADIVTEIESYTTNDEEAKKLETKAPVMEIFMKWLEGFILNQPSEYFVDHPTDDADLVCNIQNELNFLISTLEIFGLPMGYMSGEGHFPNWGKDNKDDKLAAVRKRALASKMK
ncbi:MAG: hypothetical protein COA94_09160 [Rickettsiales bacterium]|nr:MAG: hypothetical protein COA94_09160 [Rickettsiales bacterium]